MEKNVYQLQKEYNNLWDETTEKIKETRKIQPHAVARLDEMKQEIDTTKVIIADENKRAIPLVVGVSTAVIAAVLGHDTGYFPTLMLSYQPEQLTMIPASVGTLCKNNFNLVRSFAINKHD